MIGIIILCRYNSNRLPGKILRKIGGKELLIYIIERLEKIKNKKEIVVATSYEESDNVIYNFCIKNNIKCFRGNLENVSRRFLDCAIKFGFESAIRINGDNLFADSNLIDDMINIFKNENLNFLSNVKNRTWPKGISVEIVNIDFYENKIKFFTDYDKEHVMTYFYNLSDHLIKHIENKVNIRSDINFAIDTKSDFDRAHAIINKMEKNHTSYNYLDILNFYR